MDYDTRKTLLIALIVLGVVLALILSSINIVINYKIKYYETPKGAVIRALNSTAEKNYRELLGTRAAMFILGLASFITALIGYGLYRIEAETMYGTSREEGEETI